MYVTCFKTTIVCTINHNWKRIETDKEGNGQHTTNVMEDVDRHMRPEQEELNEKRNGQEENWIGSPAGIRNSYCEEESRKNGHPLIETKK